MQQYIIAYDLGTGGNKASLYEQNGQCVASTFVPYDTLYPQAGWHEQRPRDWWQAVVESTTRLLAETGVDTHAILACGISGHSLGCVPLDQAGRLLRETTPIWSDSRAVDQTRAFFEKVDEAQWYQTTGNGFPAPLYTVFKVMWYRDHEPDMFRNIDTVIGTKDFINYRLTGRIVTDYSYASGSGVYDLLQWDYSDRLIEAGGLPRSIFPAIVPSTEVLGELTADAAEALGLPRTVKVVAGGVDNSCMALGARNIKDGRVYNSLGSSSWIPVCSANPLLDAQTRPYVFTHVIPGLFTSALSIFSSGTSFQWVRDQLCQNLVAQAQREGRDPYEVMTDLAARSPVGANHLLFNPSLGGGTSLDASINIRGAFLGLDLRHTQADLIRAAMEGITMGLRLALDALQKLTPLSDEILVVGGGSRSLLWRQIYADVYNLKIIKTTVDQQAAALGAAALAAVGTGLWPDFDIIDDIHQIESVIPPIPEHVRVYERLLPIFAKAAQYQAELGDLLAAMPANE
jgi:xylulokinase